MKKKLIYIIPSLGIGGAEVALMDAIPELDKNFDFRIICLEDTPNIDYLNTKKNIKVFKGVGINYIRAFFYIRKFKPDILISSLWKGAILGTLSKFIFPKLFYIEFIHSSQFFHAFDSFFTKKAVQTCDTIFCDSVSSQSFIKQYAKNKQIHIISFLRFSSIKPWERKKELRLKGLFVGRFHPQKRIDRLVILMKELQNRGIFFTIDLYGRDNGSMGQIKSLIEENNLRDRLFIKGEISPNQVKGLFPYYDFYFQTSQVEGMAMTVVEAMQHGLIPIITAVGEIPNYAKNNENSILIPNDHFEEELEKTICSIKKIIENIDSANYISLNAYKTFLQKEVYTTSLINSINNVTNSA